MAAAAFSFFFKKKELLKKKVHEIFSRLCTEYSFSGGIQM